MGMIRRFRTLAQEYMKVRDGLEPDQKEKPTPVIGAPFWPHEVLRDLSIFFFILSMVLFLNWWGPPPLHGPADPFSTPVPPPLPDWYILWAFGLIKLATDIEINGVVLITGKVLGLVLVVIPFLLLFVLPFLDKGKAKRPVESPVMASIGVLGITFIFFVSLYSVKHLVTHYYTYMTDDILALFILAFPLGFAGLTYLGLKRKQRKRTYQNELNNCYQCGKCDAHCPLHEVYDIPKINLVQSNHVTGGFSHPYLCFTCGRCQAHCPIGKKMIPLVRKQRERDVARRAKGLRVKERLEHAHKGIFNKLAILEAKLKPKKPVPKGHHRYGFIPGCVDILPLMNIQVEHVGIKNASLELMKKAGLDVVLLDPGCCGHDQLWQGNTKLFKVLMNKNKDYLKRCNVDILVTSCAECYHTVSTYYKLKKPIIHISELLQKADMEFEVPDAPNGKKKAVVAYHDPCRMGRLMGSYNAPRNMIGMVPGIKVVEFKDNREKAICCAVPAMTQCTPINKHYRIKKLDEAAKKKVDYFVTTCPKCVAHYGCVRDEDGEKYDMEIMDLSVFLAHCLNKPKPKIVSEGITKAEGDIELSESTKPIKEPAKGGVS